MPSQMSGQDERGLRLLSIGTAILHRSRLPLTTLSRLLSRWRGNSGVVAAPHTEGDPIPNKAGKAAPGSSAPMRYL